MVDEEGTTQEEARKRRARSPRTDDPAFARTRDLYSEIDRLGWRQEDFKEDFKQFEGKVNKLGADVETVKQGVADLKNEFTDMHRRLFGFGPTEPGALGRIEEQVQATTENLTGSAAVTVLKWAAGIMAVILAAVILAWVFHIGSFTTTK